MTNPTIASRSKWNMGKILAFLAYNKTNQIMQLGAIL